MADIKETINVDGNFKQQVQVFVNGLVKARSEFKNLIVGISTGSKNINDSMTLAQKAVDRYASQFINQGDTVENAIKRATDKVERYQKASVDRLAKKYISLGNTIQEAYNSAQKDVNMKWNGDIAKNENTVSSSAMEFFNSSFGKGLTVLGSIQMGIKSIEGIFKLANGISSQTLNAIDKLSFGMASGKGVISSVKSGMEYEDVFSNINVLSNNVKGADPKEIMKQATSLAIRTRFSETETAKNAEWMLKAGAMPDERLQKALVDLASLLPERGGDHGGEAVYKALNGDSSIINDYGVSNAELVKFQKTLTGKDKTSTNKALEKSGSGYAIRNRDQWINLFELYMEKKYNNLALEQSSTMSGLISTIFGQINQIGSDLSGYNTQRNEVDKGTMYDVIKSAIGGFDENNNASGLTKFINDLPEQSYFKEFRLNLGDLVQSVVEAGATLNENGLVENLFNLANDFTKTITDFINSLKDDGTLDKIATDLPKLVKASLDYEMAKVNALVKAEPLIPAATNFLETITDFIDFISGKDKQLGENGRNAIDTGLDIATNSNLQAKTLYLGGKFLAEKGNGIGDWLGGLFGGNTVKSYSDADINSMIDNSSTISQKEKETVKETIEKDGVNHYEININGNMSDDAIIRKLIDEIERIQSNR